MRLTLQRAVLGAIGAAVLAGIVPAGVALDRRVAHTLEQKARDDLALAPRLLNDRRAATGDAMMMHAKELAQTRGLPEAMAHADHAAALRVVEQVRATYADGLPVARSSVDGVRIGPAVPDSLVAETARGKMPVALTSDGDRIRDVALAPVSFNGRWVGAAGFASPVDDRAAGSLSGLARADVIIVARGAARPSGSSLDSATTAALFGRLQAVVEDGVPHELPRHGLRYLVVGAPLGDAGTAYFLRSLDEELAVFPTLRRTAIVAALGALAIALVLGALLSTRVTEPVGTLARAATALGEGEFSAPLPASRLREVSLLSQSFAGMRLALAARLEDLREANVALADRNARLSALHADLIQRGRLEATGRLVAQLAHEIRNPVANLRNLLEVIRRRVVGDAQARDFADLAIDELLRMHELAEQMLDLNRPRDPKTQTCSPLAVCREVALLATAALSPDDLSIDVTGDETATAAITPDALKQVLLNLVQNARESMRARPDVPPRVQLEVSRRQTGIVVDVRDNGPGIPEQIRTRIFDPFFTTKDAVQGVGLGLFVAEGLVRSVGGQLTLLPSPTGATFRMVLPDAPVVANGSPGAGERTRHSEATP